jgi:hypothetical protein
MMRITELIGQKLQWIQPNALRMDFELRAGDTAVATLRFRHRSGSFATAESSDGSWTFKRVGFWQTRVTIRESGAESDLAVFRNGTWGGGGTLELPDGRRYPANSKSWASQYEFRTETGEALITHRQIGGMLRMSAEVEVHDLAKDMAEIPWMVLLGWYLSVMMSMDYAA